MLMKNLKTYLAGPINHKNPEAFAYSKKWREDLAIELLAMNIDSLDPLKRTGGDSITPELRSKLKTASFEGDLETINKIVGDIIIPPDLAMVEASDFITLYLPKRIDSFLDLFELKNLCENLNDSISFNDDKKIMDYISKNIYEVCGTYGEATLAKFLNIPVYLITERENNEIPEWLTGCCKDVFNSWDAYLLHIFNTYYMVV
jgi:hypothetical protein